MISVGGDSASQNFMLGQQGINYQAELLHTAKSPSRRAGLTTSGGVATSLQHVVHTYERGVEHLYINGVEQLTVVAGTTSLGGNYSNWDPSYLFNIGNEGSSDQPFSGEIYAVAVYDRALTLAEVQQNLAAGSASVPSFNAEPTAFAGLDQAVVLPNDITLAGAFTDDGLPNPPAAVTLAWSQVSGPELGATFGDATSATSSVSFSAAGTYVLRLTANDGVVDGTDDIEVVVSFPVVPDVAGQTVVDATAAIVASGFTVNPVNATATSTTVAIGSVISTDPAAGAAVAPGTEVTLTVSLGTVVPNVVGDPQATAESAIVAAGLTVGTVTTATSSTVPTGSVISQSPSGGAIRDLNTPVDLVVSSGTVVPNVVNQTVASATNNIQSAGLTVNPVNNTAYSASVAAGRVVSQSPSGGAIRDLGTQVTLTVSLGPNTKPTLSFIPDQTLSEGEPKYVSITASDAELDALSFSATGLQDFMTLDDNGGPPGTGSATLSIEPGPDDSGVYQVTIRVTDDRTTPGPLWDEQTVSITVDDVGGGDIKIVVMGSSTAVGTGASSLSNSWVGKLSSHLAAARSCTDFENAATDCVIRQTLGGTTTVDFRPDGSPGSDANINITRAIEKAPDLIIINLPSNNVNEGISAETTISHYQEIKAVADSAGIPIFLTTTQPRNFTALSKRQLLQVEAVALIGRRNAH
jgi:beta-lactam-binding protein with PASTA domain